MRLAIMQPYFFPYLGYFQLIKSVDHFFIYDDVNFIKQGWINRNRILINNQPHFLTLKLRNVSSFKKINEICIEFEKEKILKTVYQAYRRAPYFEQGFALFSKVMEYDEINLADFVTHSLQVIVASVGITTNFSRASCSRIAKGQKGENRILEICKHFGAHTYINPIGGVDLYRKSEFQASNIELLFLKSHLPKYNQLGPEFIPGLSFLDVLMFNEISEISSMLGRYDLI